MFVIAHISSYIMCEHTIARARARMHAYGYGCKHAYQTYACTCGFCTNVFRDSNGVFACERASKCPY